MNPRERFGFCYITLLIRISINSESVCFISFLIIFKGYTSHSQQLGHTDELLTGKPSHLPRRGVEVFLPKSFSGTRPGSCDIRQHGKSNPKNLQNWCFPVGILCQTKITFPIPGPQQQQPVLVTCPWGSWGGNNCQLQPGRTAEWCLCQQVVPDKDPSVSGLFIPQLPILPKLQELQLPYIPDCVSTYVIHCSNVNKIAEEPAVL